MIVYTEKTSGVKVIIVQRYDNHVVFQYPNSSNPTKLHVETNEEFEKYCKKAEASSRYGSVWKYKGDTTGDLYMVSNVDFSSCAYYALTNLQTGAVGPLWNNKIDMLEDLEYVADNIMEIR